MSLTTPNLVSNGGFENGLASWSPSGNVESFDAGRQSEGALYANFNGHGGPSGGVISQAIATEAGQTYLITFDAGVNGAPTTTNFLHVELLNGTDALLDTTIHADNTGTNGYTTYSYTFVATGALTTIRFTDLSTGDLTPVDLQRSEEHTSE